ncbi:MAG: hypothetical protein MHM6MM_003057 [Cercozoa sp. M6MM]
MEDQTTGAEDQAGVVFLDSASSTRVLDEALTSMAPFNKEYYANSGGSYPFARVSADAIEEARRVIAESVGVHEAEHVVFGASGTESNNQVLFGLSARAFLRRGSRPRQQCLVTQPSEHASVLRPLQQCAQLFGQRVQLLDVDADGLVQPSQLRALLESNAAADADTVVVSVMQANNRNGSVQPVRELLAICREFGVPFHTDACQSYGKMDLDASCADYITLNSHKIHGPKGASALVCTTSEARQRLQEAPALMAGCAQEGGLRAGTHNTAAIAGFAAAVRALVLDKERNAAFRRHSRQLRDLLWQRLQQLCGQNVRLVGPPCDGPRLCSHLCVTFPNACLTQLRAFLGDKNICQSAGATCNKGSTDGAILRLTIGAFTEETDVTECIDALREFFATN